ncbi:MAG: hypothetical protein F6J93_17805 [Oscillatoria sp. SIO1A7]|nr:hypothetical protein [Oscillatoria sp. SIO1A7]
MFFLSGDRYPTLISNFSLGRSLFLLFLANSQRPPWQLSTRVCTTVCTGVCDLKNTELIVIRTSQMNWVSFVCFG